MNPNAVTNAFSEKYGIDKGEILNRDDDNIASRVGQIEAQIIKETKEWMT